VPPHAFHQDAWVDAKDGDADVLACRAGTGSDWAYTNVCPHCGKGYAYGGTYFDKHVAACAKATPATAKPTRHSQRPKASQQQPAASRAAKRPACVAGEAANGIVVEGAGPAPPPKRQRLRDFNALRDEAQEAMDTERPDREKVTERIKELMDAQYPNMNQLIAQDPGILPVVAAQRDEFEKMAVDELSVIANAYKEMARAAERLEETLSLRPSK
jgi:hypothetical protein